MDILASIDAATESLCACGCGRKLPDAGPSAWFAEQDCQKRWADSRAIKPYEVYARPEPHWSEAELDAMGAPPRRRSEHVTAIVEMVTEYRQTLAPRRPARRGPVVDQPRTGCRLSLFVGGPWDSDVRAVPVGEDYWMVASEPLGYFVEETEETAALSMPATTAYSARTVWVCLPPMYELGLYERYEARLRVFAAGNPSDGELMAAAERALCAGWQPWLYG